LVAKYKSYRVYWILLAVTAVYSVTIAFLPWLGYEESDTMVETSSWAVVGFIMLGVLFLMVYLRNHLRSAEPIRVDQEQVLPDKVKYSREAVQTGRKIAPQRQVEKRDRWEDGSCKETYVKDLCTTCVHYRRKYYGNYCKHFGMVVDRPTSAE